MDDSTAKKVIQTMLAANSDCAGCAIKIIVRFSDEFPEHRELAIELYEQHFEIVYCSCGLD